MTKSDYMHRTMRTSISIVTVVRNSREGISITMDSILRQKEAVYEYIVVDGKSTDGTFDIVKKHPAPFIAWSEIDCGIYNAMNKGIIRSKGEWIGLINAGDFYFPWTLGAVAKAIEINPEVDIIHGDQLYYEEYKSFCFLRRQIPRYGKMKLADGPVVFHPTCFVRRSLYDKIGLYDESYRIDADYEFMLRAESAGARFLYIPTLLAGYRAGGASGSCVRYSEGYRILRQYNIHRYLKNTLLFMRCIAIKAISRVINLESRLERKRLEIS